MKRVLWALLAAGCACACDRSVARERGAGRDSGPRAVRPTAGLPIAEPPPQFSDSFDGADNTRDDAGLNDLPQGRQFGSLGPTTYTRVSGNPFSNDPPVKWWSQVNHPVYPNALSFHLMPSALRLDQPITPDPSGAYRLSFAVEPRADLAAGASPDWVSIMLRRSADARSYVTDVDTEFGLLVRSNGGLGIVHRGTFVATDPPAVPPSRRYEVDLALRDRLVFGTINGVLFSAELPSPAPPAPAYLYLGAYFTTPGTSRLDDLAVSPRAHHVAYYGYHWAESLPYGSHLAEVKGHSNIGFAQRPEDLTQCAAQGVPCLVEARWQFFTTGPGLRSDYEAQWQAFVAAIRPNLGSVVGFYLVDEPNVHGISADDLDACVNYIKCKNAAGGSVSPCPHADVNDLPLLLVHDPVSVANAGASPPSPLHVPANVDWVAVDVYRPFSEALAAIKILRSRLGPSQRLWLVPQTFVPTYEPFECGVTPDAALALRNWQYYDLARADPRVLGLLNFGLWTHQLPATLPLALAAQQAIGVDLTAFR